MGTVMGFDGRLTFLDGIEAHGRRGCRRGASGKRVLLMATNWGSAVDDGFAR